MQTLTCICRALLDVLLFLGFEELKNRATG